MNQRISAEGESGYAISFGRGVNEFRIADAVTLVLVEDAVRTLPPGTRFDVRHRLVEGYSEPENFRMGWYRHPSMDAEAEWTGQNRFVTPSDAEENVG